jgi:hypothetical protein
MTHIDLEDAIYLAWRTSDDLELFFKYHGDHPKPMTEDEVSNMIYGIQKLHDMRMEKLFDVFKKVHELDEYCTDPEKLANREKLTRVCAKVTEEMFKEPKKGKKK